MHIINSRQNQEIISAASLHQKKHRDQQRQFLAEGLRTCLTLIAKMQLVRLYATQDGSAQLQAHGYTSTVTLVSQPVMEKLSAATTPSGIVGVFAIPQEPSWTRVQSGIVLANVSDPGNMGSLIRSCAAFGGHSVIVIDGVDVWHPKVVQASAGTHGFVDIITTTWENLLQNKPTTTTLVALVAKDGIPLTTFKRQKDTLLVIGNEAHGIPNEWIQQCTHRVTIAMPGKTESLNAAIAGSIALYALMF